MRIFDVESLPAWHLLQLSQNGFQQFVLIDSLQNKREKKFKKIETLFENQSMDITRMVSRCGSSSSTIIKPSGVPSKSSRCVRMRFSSLCFAKWAPSTEYQCSSSTGDCMATQVFIWFSMNANRAELFHDVFILWEILLKRIFVIDLFTLNVIFFSKEISPLTILVCSVNLAVADRQLTESNRVGTYSSFYADCEVLSKFQVGLSDPDCSMWSFKMNTI